MPTYQQDVQFNTAIVVKLRWPDFKSILISKGLSLQYISREDSYTIFALDENISYTCFLVYLEKSVDFPFDADYSKDQNDADLVEFETAFKAIANKTTSKVDDSFRPITVPEPRVGSETIYTTHNFCDKVTWFTTSERINDEVLTSNDGYVWNSINTYWIDMCSGRIQDDDGWIEQQRELNPNDPHGYQVVIKVDGVEKTMREPFFTTGGDYDVYWNDGYITSFEDWSGKTVTASYSKAVDSTFILAPLPGKKLNIEAAEADFTEDVEMYDAIEYVVYGYAAIFAPQLNLPEGTKIPIKKTTYKRLSQIFNEAIGAYPLIEVLGADPNHIAMQPKDRRKFSRGMGSKVQSIPFRYGTVRTLQSSYGLELRVKLTHDIEYEGDLATCTLYCTSENE